MAGCLTAAPAAGDRSLRKSLVLPVEPPRSTLPGCGRARVSPSSPSARGAAAVEAEDFFAYPTYILLLSIDVNILMTLLVNFTLIQRSDSA